MFLSYEEYISYGGGLDEAAFNLYGYEAQMRVSAETHNRIKNPSEAVKRCVARLADIIKSSDVGKETVTSWSNDGVSQSIKNISCEDYETQIKKVLHDYLISEVDDNGVPLLYLGVECYD